jgi:hypothetical protein
MTRAVMLLPDSTVGMISEISAAIEHEDGVRPNRSQVCRLAIAALRRQLLEQGRLSVPLASSASAEAE